MQRSPSASSLLHARRGQRLLMGFHDMIAKSHVAASCRPARARTLKRGRTGRPFTSRLTFHSHRKCSLSLRCVEKHQFA